MLQASIHQKVRKFRHHTKCQNLNEYLLLQVCGYWGPYNPKEKWIMILSSLSYKWLVFRKLKTRTTEGKGRVELVLWAALASTTHLTGWMEDTGSLNFWMCDLGSSSEIRMSHNHQSILGINESVTSQDYQLITSIIGFHLTLSF